MKIYIILNTSYECDSYEDNSKIEFVTTSLKDAETKWKCYYECFKDMNSDNWIHSAELIEINDGYFYYDVEQKNNYKILKTVSNIED